MTKTKRNMLRLCVRGDVEDVWVAVFASYLEVAFVNAKRKATKPVQPDVAAIQRCVERSRALKTEQ